MSSLNILIHLNLLNLIVLVENDDITKTESTYGKTTVVVTYRDFHIEKNVKQSLLKIGIGNGVAFNSLLGLPTLHSWKFVLDVTKEREMSDYFNILFPILFQLV